MADVINTMLDEIIDDLRYALKEAISYKRECGDDASELIKLRVKYFGH